MNCGVKMGQAAEGGPIGPKYRGVFVGFIVGTGAMLCNICMGCG